jgi:tyrosine aminotransferase
MRGLIDERTKAILINNPSNPCGSNFSTTHLLGILDVARTFNLPIIADEIYGGVVFGPEPFIPINSLADDVVILSVGGNFCVRSVVKHIF